MWMERAQFREQRRQHERVAEKQMMGDQNTLGLRDAGPPRRDKTLHDCASDHARSAAESVPLPIDERAHRWPA